MDFVVPRNRSVAQLLKHAASADLEVLADLITDNGKGRVALDSKIKDKICKHRAQGRLSAIADVLEAEIRAFGGNSIANLFRSTGVTYEEIATDVAKKLGAKPSPQDDLFAVEECIIRQLVKNHMGDDVATESLSAAKLARYIPPIVKVLITAAGNVGGIVATGGAAGVAGGMGGRLLALVAPPLAIGAAGASLYQATAPAFRITTPAVLLLAKIRLARYEADFAAYTEKLRACM